MLYPVDKSLMSILTLKVKIHMNGLWILSFVERYLCKDSKTQAFFGHVIIILHQQEKENLIYGKKWPHIRIFTYHYV